MKDFGSTLLIQLNNSKEFQKYIEDFNCMRDNIVNGRDINELFQMLKDNDMFKPLRKMMRKVIDNYVRNLLRDTDLESLYIYPSYSSCFISFESSKIPSFEYAPRHWAGPPNELVNIDFTKREIKVFDFEYEYKKADELYKKKIAEEKERLKKLKDELELMKQKRKSRAFILKIIRENLPVIMHKYILFHISCYLLPSRYKELLKVADKMIERQEKRVRDQEQRVYEFESIDYMDIYKKLRALQEEILERFKPLGFTIITVLAESRFD